MSIISLFQNELYPLNGITDIAQANNGYQTGSSYNYSINVQGTNRAVFVSVSMLSVAGSTVTSIDVGGVTATLYASKASVSGAVRVEIWQAIAPPVGFQTITVNFSASIASVSSAFSVDGVDQTTPLEAHNEASATNVGAADATVDVTPISNNAWIYANVATDDTAITLGSEQLARSNVTGALGSGASSTKHVIATPAATTMLYTNVAALATWTIVSVAIKPASGVAETITVDKWWRPQNQPYFERDQVVAY